MNRASLVVLAIVAAGCGGDRASSGRPPRGSAGSDPQAPTSTPIADGSLFGFIRAIGAARSGAILTIDPATMLTGDAANRAAAEDGATELPVPNDYYIDDDDPATIDLPVAPSAVFTVQGEDGQGGDPADLHRVDPARFLSFYGAAPSYFAAVPYRIAIAGGVVTAVEQVYLP